jgi:hypothetical protein
MDPTDLARYAARDLGSPPMYHGTAAVRCRLKSRVILWVGDEWCVTEFGLEKTNGAFPIRASRLWDGEDTIGWVHAMSAIDEVTVLSDFAEGLRLARGVAAGRLNRRALRPSFAAVG